AAGSAPAGCESPWAGSPGTTAGTGSPGAGTPASGRPDGGPDGQPGADGPGENRPPENGPANNPPVNNRPPDNRPPGTGSPAGSTTGSRTSSACADGSPAASSLTLCSPICRRRRAGGRRRHARVLVHAQLDRLLTARPPDGQLAEWAYLFERDQALPVQLQQCQEPGHHLQGGTAVTAERPEAGRAGTQQLLPQCGRMLPDADPFVVHVRGGDLRRPLRRQGPGGQGRQPVRPDPQHQVGQGLRVPRLQRDRPRPAGGARLHQPGQVGGGLLEGLVLQEPGEEQVSRLQQGQILLVLDRRGGQQPRGLQIQQGGGDHQELADLVQVPVVAHGPDVGEEVVGHLVQRDLGDVQLVLADQLQQQVEGPGEVVEPDREAATAGPVAGRRLSRHVPLGPRSPRGRAAGSYGLRRRPDPAW